MNPLFFFVQFLHDLNAITNVDLISSNNKNISVLIIHEFLSETLQVFWEIISTMSTPLLLSLATEIQTHIELQHNNFTLKYYTDYYFGLTMFELLNNNQDITQFSQSFDYLQIFTFQRIAKYNQFSYDFSFDLQLTKFPMRGNPMVPVKTWFTSTFAFAVQFNLSFAKNTALFTELCYYLKEKGVSSFIKSCQKNGISENYAYDLLMRCIKFDSTSTLFQQSSIDIWKMSQYDVRSLIKDDIIGVVVNNDINTFISFDLFNPFMLLLDEEKLKKITNIYLILCSVDNYPILCGTKVDGWRKEVICKQDILINLCALSMRNSSLVSLIILLLWMRICSECKIPSHPVNKSVVKLLSNYQTKSMLCCNTVWRLIIEYDKVDSTLVDEFYKLKN
ncbi:UBR-type domain-containing protein [Entamoeba marina]